jgi:hypothetical protein
MEHFLSKLPKPQHPGVCQKARTRMPGLGLFLMLDWSLGSYTSENPECSATGNIHLRPPS